MAPLGASAAPEGSPIPEAASRDGTVSAEGEETSEAAAQATEDVASSEGLDHQSARTQEPDDAAAPGVIEAAAEQASAAANVDAPGADPTDPPAASPTPAEASASTEAPPKDSRGPAAPQLETGADGFAAVRTVAELVRAKARFNREHGISTYSGKDPHPRIKQAVGFERGRVGGAPADAAKSVPPQTPTEAALTALDSDVVADAVEASAPTGKGGDDAAMRRALTQWLDQNMPRLLEDMVREQLSRRADGEE